MLLSSLFPSACKAEIYPGETRKEEEEVFYHYYYNFFHKKSYVRNRGRRSAYTSKLRKEGRRKSDPLFPLKVLLLSFWHISNGSLWSYFSLFFLCFPDNSMCCYQKGQKHTQLERKKLCSSSYWVFVIDYSTKVIWEDVISLKTYKLVDSLSFKSYCYHNK